MVSSQYDIYLKSLLVTGLQSAFCCSLQQESYIQSCTCTTSARLTELGHFIIKSAIKNKDFKIVNVTHDTYTNTVVPILGKLGQVKKHIFSIKQQLTAKNKTNTTSLPAH